MIAIELQEGKNHVQTVGLFTTDSGRKIDDVIVKSGEVEIKSFGNLREKAAVRVTYVGDDFICGHVDMREIGFRGTVSFKGHFVAAIQKQEK